MPKRFFETTAVNTTGIAQALAAEMVLAGWTLIQVGSFNRHVLSTTGLADDTRCFVIINPGPGAGEFTVSTLAFAEAANPEPLESDLIVSRVMTMTSLGPFTITGIVDEYACTVFIHHDTPDGFIYFSVGSLAGGTANGDSWVPEYMRAFAVTRSETVDSGSAQFYETDRDLEGLVQIAPVSELVNASATFFFLTGFDILDGETFTLEDAAGLFVTFEFDLGGGGVSGGNVAIVYVGNEFANAFGPLIEGVINGSAIQITATYTSGTTMDVVQDISGQAGATGPVPETVVANGFSFGQGFTQGTAVGQTMQVVTQVSGPIVPAPSRGSWAGGLNFTGAVTPPNIQLALITDGTYPAGALLGMWPMPSYVTTGLTGAGDLQIDLLIGIDATAPQIDAGMIARRFLEDDSVYNGTLLGWGSGTSNLPFGGANFLVCAPLYFKDGDPGRFVGFIPFMRILIDESGSPGFEPGRGERIRVGEDLFLAPEGSNATLTTPGGTILLGPVPE